MLPALNLQRGLSPLALVLLFSQSALAWVSFSFYANGDTTTPGPHFEVQNNVTSFVCLNLEDIFSNSETAPDATTSGNSTSDSPLFTLDGVTYTRPAGWNGGASDGSNYDPEAQYDRWNVGQGYWELNTEPLSGDSNVSAAMQINVYGEAGCKNETNPWLGYSCQTSNPQQAGAGWGAKSVSLEPYDVNAAECLFNATNGVEESGAAHFSAGRSLLALCMVLAAGMMVL